MESDRFGRRIRAFRKLKLVSQINLAKKLGIATTVLSKVERGQTMPTEELLNDIARCLNIHVRELTGDEKFIIIEEAQQLDDNDE